MVQKFMKKMSANGIVKRAAPLLVAVILITGTALPVCAATAEPVDETASASQLLTFWSDLMHWFSDSVDAASAMYYPSDTGLTFLGVILCGLLGLGVGAALILWIYKFLCDV